MNIETTASAAETIEADALVVPAFEGQAPGGAAGAVLAELYESGEFLGKPLDLALIHRPAGFRARRLLAVGVGKAAEFNPHSLRRAAGAALRRLKGKGVRSVAFHLAGASAEDGFAAAAVEGAILGDFEPDRHRTDPEKKDKVIERAIFSGASEAAAERGRIVGEAQNFARELANEPPNVLTPLALAGHARRMATEEGLECEVLERDRMTQLGMGALLGVAVGSAQPPALIVLRYRPPGAAAGGDHLGLVGKGVTFDTGGISIKPSDGMEKMKYDMAGGAAVIGAMRAIARFKPAIPVTALIPAVENMPGGKAQRPGDIVKTLDGKTVEVLNTDAEGRLILIDAITYARRLGCTHLVDAATLTGAIVVALGNLNVGAFTNNNAFLDKLLASAKAAGERIWPMPLEDDYKEAIKSAVADLQNIGGRAGGAIVAAMFLREFAGETPWIHLDIAGVAWLDDAKPDMAKGPTGAGLRSFVHLATHWG